MTISDVMLSSSKQILSSCCAAVAYCGGNDIIIRQKKYIERRTGENNIQISHREATIWST